MSKKKAVIIGEYSVVEYHPLAGTDKALQDILTGFEVDCTEDYNAFKAENLGNYDLCISFVDHWKESLTDEQTAGLLTFTCNGGGLLLLHNGIAIQNRFELAQLVGGKFVQHPEEKILTYYPVAADHVIMEGIGSFAFQDEPYQFELDGFTEKTLLLEYESEGKRWPSGWAHQYGSGRVVYLSPGHHGESYRDPMYSRLIYRSALWCIGML